MFGVTVIIGTRPEAIKLAPLILELKKHNLVKTRVILSGQHKDIVSQVMNLFKIKEDKNLLVFKKNQSLGSINAKILSKMESEFKEHQTDLVIVQGDTTTAFSAAIAAFYKKIAIAHVEAGLRTEDLYEPFPEEANRRLISQIASLHFAPTKSSKSNLLNSGIDNKSIVISGNTVIDALLYVSNNLNPKEYKKFKDEKIILATIHRRENWGEPLSSICDGLKLILKKYPDHKIIIPMHPNKEVRRIIKEKLKSYNQAVLLEPLPYDALVFLLKSCKFVLTDSGGLQEEAPAFGKPVLVLRGNTERVEALSAGTTKLVGTDASKIFKSSDLLLSNVKEYNKMANAINPYGDGHSSKLISIECINFLKNI